MRSRLVQSNSADAMYPLVYFDLKSKNSMMEAYLDRLRKR